MNINSKLITLFDIVSQKEFFNVPIYQRLYVWEQEQVKTLLEDIETAFTAGKEMFYLGGVLVVENKPECNETMFDLIDGQQRFTTLWMIAIVFEGALTPFIQQIEHDEWKPRMTFAIRDPINRFFEKYIRGNDPNGKVKSTQIQNALGLIEDYKHQLEATEPGRSKEFAAYIYRKVKLIFTTVPKQTDLNKLFELINNRGVQLKHHEILKSRLLNKLSPDERLKYSYLWDACAIMAGYIEKNIKDIANVKIQELYDNEASKSGTEDLADPTKVLHAIGGLDDNEIHPKSLISILETEDPIGRQEHRTDYEDDGYEADEIRSIISFEMLLQHTLRIFLANKRRRDIERILDKELLRIFSNHLLTDSITRDEVKEFIELLWKVRYWFDKHVIKWVHQEDDETHLICKLEKYTSKNKYYLRRRQPVSNEGIALLQSLLYHSQQITTHYWLTPYLAYLVENKGRGAYRYLKHLDNHLLCSVEDEPLIKRTRKFLEDPTYSAELSINVLTQPLGTAFPHYWFYKLEFILWEKLASSKDHRWRNFKMTAKNSVEHISPQTQKPTDSNTVSAKMLNHFGNLALVSRSINSEYSNLPFNEKRQRFINNNRAKVDSLKMDLIYLNEAWSDALALKHQESMIMIINEYLGLNAE